MGDTLRILNTKKLGLSGDFLFSIFLIVSLHCFAVDKSFASSNSCNDFTNDGFDDFLRRDTQDWIIIPNKLGGSDDQPIKITGATNVQDWRLIGTGSFNNDNNCDILIRHAHSGAVYVYYLAEGKIISRGYSDFNLSSDDEIELLIDFNKDGYTDLLTRSKSTGKWNVKFTEGRRSTHSLTIDRATDKTWVLVGAGSIDHDKYPDLLLWNRLSRRYFMFLSSELSFTRLRYVNFETPITKHSAPVIFKNLGTSKKGTLITRNFLTGAWQALELSEDVAKRSILDKKLQESAPKSWSHELLTAGTFISSNSIDLIYLDNYKKEAYGFTYSPSIEGKNTVTFLQEDILQTRRHNMPTPLLPNRTAQDLAILLNQFIRASQIKIENIDRVNYYYESYRLIQASRLYLYPQRYRLSSTDHKKIEAYLLELSEGYFAACSGYDFESGARSSCRSPNTNLGYYMWRSPLNDNAPYRTAHAKVEWLSAAGVSAAVSALLAKGSEEVQIRALAVKALILKHVWEKWNDKNFVTAMDLPADFLMDNSKVIHYVAWQGIIGDLLFPDQLDSKIISRLNGFVNSNSDERYINFICSLENNCRWRQYDLKDSSSNDLSHLSYPLGYYFDKSIYEDKIIATLNDVTFANFEKESFPKFDMFFNGHCIDNHTNVADPLYEYCNLYWFDESVTNRSHRQLFGLARYGTKDSALGIKILEASDTNKDGSLTIDDELILDFLVDLIDVSHQLTK